MKNALIAIVVLVLIVLGIVYWKGQDSVTNPGNNGQNITQPGSDDTSVEDIEKDLQNVDLGDVDSELKSIDQDLQSL